MKKWICLFLLIVDITLIVNMFYQLGRLYAFTP
jgi:hypothetical protein